MKVSMMGCLVLDIIACFLGSAPESRRVFVSDKILMTTSTFSTSNFLMGERYANWARLACSKKISSSPGSDTSAWT